MSGNPFQSRPIEEKKQSVAKKPPVVKKRFRLFKSVLPENGLFKWLNKIIFVFAGLGILYSIFVWLTLPAIEFDSFLATQSSSITDRNGIELYRLHGGEDRTVIPTESIPRYLKDAIIAIEDERFYERSCLDTRALLRAVFTLGKRGGGSTITRQLARNALDLKQKPQIDIKPLWLAMQLDRKVKEVILGCQMEGAFEKEELLGLYLNWIPFGGNAYGIEKAGRLYFGVSGQDLSLAQSVVLAALPQRPTYFSPYRSHVRSQVTDEAYQKIISGEISSAGQLSENDIIIGLIGNEVGTGSTRLYVGGRTDQVLFNMEQQGLIEEPERLQALNELAAIEFQPDQENIKAPHFVLWIRDQVEKMFAGNAEKGILERGGWTIKTTLDWPLQETAQQIIEQKKDGVLEAYGAHNIALLALDAKTNEIMAYIGNTDFSDENYGGKIDMVHIPRQPGSSFKPIVYASAFNEGYSPATVLYDVPTKIGDDQPQNFDGSYMGLMTIRDALGASRNIPAAKAFFLAGGEDKILSLASQLGATTPRQKKKEFSLQKQFEYGWPLALGAAETPLIEMTNVYSTLGREGNFLPVVSIISITDQQGNVIPLPFSEPDPVPAIAPRIAYQITSVLSDESVRPEGFWRTQLSVPGYQSAAKTGTSNKCMEYDDDGLCLLKKPDNAWTIGYTPVLTTGIWIGNVDNAALYEKAGGLNTASPIWHEFMKRAHKIVYSDNKTFPEPPGLVTLQISTLSGQLPTDCTPVEMRRAEIFLSERVPTEQDPACVRLKVDKLTHLLSNAECPEEAAEEQSFLQPRSVSPNRWPLWEAAVKEWAQKQTELWYQKDAGSGAVVIPLPLAPTEPCRLDLTPGRLNKPEVTIVYPMPGGVADYPSFKPRLELDVHPGSAILSIAYFVDDKMVAETSSGSLARAIRVPRSVDKAGVHSFSVRVEDKYYNVVEKEVDFFFEKDTGRPTVKLIKPDDDLLINSGDTLSILAEAGDSGGGIKQVQFYLDDLLLTNKPKEPYSFQYEFNHEDGVYRLRAVAEDYAGNTSEDRIIITIGSAGGSLSDSDVSTAPADQTGNKDLPKITSPSASLTEVKKDQPVDLSIYVPSMEKLDLIVLYCVAEHEESKRTVELLRLREGKGTYIRQWIPQMYGKYIIRLSGQDNQREDHVWEEREFIVK